MLAWAGAASAGAVTRVHAARPSSIRLVSPVQQAAAVDDGVFPASEVEMMNNAFGYNMCLDAENDSGGSPFDNGETVPYKGDRTWRGRSCAKW